MEEVKAGGTAVQGERGESVGGGRVREGGAGIG